MALKQLIVLGFCLIVIVISAPQDLRREKRSPQNVWWYIPNQTKNSDDNTREIYQNPSTNRNPILYTYTVLQNYTEAPNNAIRSDNQNMPFEEKPNFRVDFISRSGAADSFKNTEATQLHEQHYSTNSKQSQASFYNIQPPSEINNNVVPLPQNYRDPITFPAASDQNRSTPERNPPHGMKIFVDNGDSSPLVRGPPPPDDRRHPPRDWGPSAHDRGPPPPHDRRPPSDDRRPPPRDWVPPPHDRGPPPRDWGPPPNDWGPPPPRDRGPPPHDRGPSPRDWDPPPHDRGPPPYDRGPPPHDWGPPPHDRGPPPHDRGPPPRDWGPPPHDRGNNWERPPPPREHESPAYYDRRPPPPPPPPPRDRWPPSYDRGPPPHDRRPPPPPPPHDRRPPPYDRGPPPHDRGPPPNDRRPPPPPPDPYYDDRRQQYESYGDGSYNNREPASNYDRRPPTYDNTNNNNQLPTVTASNGLNTPSPAINQAAIEAIFGKIPELKPEALVNKEHGVPLMINDNTQSNNNNHPIRPPLFQAVPITPED